MKLGRIILLALGISPFTGLHASEVVKITNGEWPPYFSETLKHHGVASRIIAEAFALEDIKVEWGFYPWPRALHLAEKGEWDGSAGWSKNAEREANLLYTDTVINQTVVFFHLKKSPFEWKTVSDLSGINIGGTIKYNYGPEFQAAESNNTITVKRVTKDELGLTMLLKGRIKIFPLDREVGLSMIQHNFSPAEAAQFTYHQQPVYMDPLHVVLTKKSARGAKLAEAFNRGLKKLQDSGKINEFLEESRRGDYEKK